jgi:hypothetical protein
MGTHMFLIVCTGGRAETTMGPSPGLGGTAAPSATRAATAPTFAPPPVMRPHEPTNPPDVHLRTSPPQTAPKAAPSPATGIPPQKPFDGLSMENSGPEKRAGPSATPTPPTQEPGRTSPSPRPPATGIRDPSVPSPSNPTGGPTPAAAAAPEGAAIEGQAGGASLARDVSNEEVRKLIAYVNS